MLFVFFLHVAGRCCSLLGVVLALVVCSLLLRFVDCRGVWFVVRWLQYVRCVLLCVDGCRLVACYCVLLLFVDLCWLFVSLLFVVASCCGFSMAFMFTVCCVPSVVVVRFVLLVVCSCLVVVCYTVVVVEGFGCC